MEPAEKILPDHEVRRAMEAILGERVKRVSGPHVRSLDDFTAWLDRAFAATRKTMELKHGEPAFYGIEQMHALENFFLDDSEQSALDSPRQQPLSMLIAATRQVIDEQYDGIQQPPRPPRAEFDPDELEGEEQDAAEATDFPTCTADMDAFMPYKKILPRKSRANDALKAKIFEQIATTAPSFDGTYTISITPEIGLTVAIDTESRSGRKLLVHEDSEDNCRAALELMRLQIEQETGFVGGRRTNEEKKGAVGRS